MCHWSRLSLIKARDHVCKLPLIDLDVDLERGAERRDLHVVPIGTAPSHAVQMTLENAVYLLGRRW